MGRGGYLGGSTIISCAGAFSGAWRKRNRPSFSTNKKKFSSSKGQKPTRVNKLQIRAVSPKKALKQAEHIARENAAAELRKAKQLTHAERSSALRLKSYLIQTVLAQNNIPLNATEQDKCKARPKCKKKRAILNRVIVVRHKRDGRTTLQIGVNSYIEPKQ